MAIDIGTCGGNTVMLGSVRESFTKDLLDSNEKGKTNEHRWHILEIIPRSLWGAGTLAKFS